MGVATVLALGVCAYFSRGRGFALDEWTFMVNRQDWTLHSFLVPTNAHLVAVPALVSKALFSTVGVGSYLPYQATTLFFQALMAWLLYLNVSRLLGNVVALIPAVLLLFFGSGWEVLINGAALDNQISISAGLGMLLCLDRNRPGGDAGAFVLLTVAVASHALGLAFAAGALVEMVFGANWRKRIWVAAVPVFLYSVWLVWAQKYGQTLISGYSVGSLPSGIFDQLAAVLAALTGLFRQPGSTDTGLVLSSLRIDRAGPLVFVLIGAIVARLWKGPRPTPRLWAVLTILVAYLVLVGIGLSTNRIPAASRYAFMASVLVLLLIAQMTEGLRVGRAPLLVAAGVATIALVPNLAQIHTAASFFKDESRYNRAELAAVELARGTVNPDFFPESSITTFLPHRDLFFTARDYFSAVDKFGSPADTEAELLAEGEDFRKVADQVDGYVLQPTFTPASGGVPGPCRTLRPAADGSFPEVTIAGGRTLLFRPTAGAQVQLRLRRFADTATVESPVSTVPATLTILPDRSSRPWHASISSAAPTVVCGA